MPKQLREDARERLARHLYLQASNPDSFAARHWDVGGEQHVDKDRWRTRADEILAVIVEES